MKAKLFILFSLSASLISACGGGSGGGAVFSPPTFSEDYSKLSVLEGSLNIKTLNATDTNNRSITFSIIDGLDKESFSVGLNGQLRFIQSPNYESPQDSDKDNKYNITIEATAGENSNQLPIEITVKDAIEGRVGINPLNAATVYIDNNSNSLLDSSDTSSSSNEGLFFLEKNFVCNGVCETKIILESGNYPVIGRTNLTTMFSPVIGDTTFSISPISTLISVSSDDSKLLNSLGISASVEEVLKLNLWDSSVDTNSLRSLLGRLNYQIGFILDITQSLFVNQDLITQYQVTTTASEKLVSLINDSAEGLRDQTKLKSFYKEVIQELNNEVVYSDQMLSSLARLTSDINKLFMNKPDTTSDPSGLGYRELIIRSYKALTNPIESFVRGYINEGNFIAGTSLTSIYSDSPIFSSLTDTDGDGNANVVDLNDDNDLVEDLADSFPLDSSETLDTDFDGIGNNADEDDDGDGVNDDSDDYPLNKDIHTTPVASLNSWAINILPKPVNTGVGTLTGTAQDGRSITFSITQNTSKGTLTLNDSSTGSFNYQTTSGVTGPSSDTFKYKVNDGYVDSNETTVNISLKSDVLYEYQWHLDNTGQLNFASATGTASKDINVDNVISQGYSGKGIKVAVVDSGLEIAHEDLKDNIVANGSYNFVDDSTDPSTTSTEGDHGTSVAGIIAASAWNDIGGRGVAPEVSLKGFNLLKDGTNANAISSLGGAAYSNDVDVFNLSYGYETTVAFLINGGIKNQFIDGVTNLRAGKGANYIASAGNGFSSFGSANCTDANTYGLSCNNPSMDPEHSLPYLTLVAALNADGTKASYSTAGSAVWISAPGGENGLDQNIVGAGYGDYSPGVMTTDQSSCTKGYVRSNLASYENVFENKGNYSLNSSCNYTSTFKGTSAAAPVISGIVALLLEVNPALTWRDIKHILASSAIQIDASIQAIIVGGYIAEPGWITNAAGYKFHNWYGFGAVDTDAAVTLAKNYTLGSLGSFTTTNETSSGNLNAAIPDNSNDGVSNTIADNNNLTVESVNINVCLSHASPSDLSISLTSPSDTRSVLLPPFNGFSNTDSCFNLISNAFYGESSNGNWSIKIVDKKANTEGSINNWKITIFGR